MKEYYLKKGTPPNELFGGVHPPPLLAGEERRGSMENEYRESFDTSDVDYLATRLTPEQLRREIHNADIQQGVARCFGEDDGITYWKHFRKACELALDIQKAKQPKVELREGWFSVKATKEAYDIVDIIGRYTELRKTGKEYVGKCPFHQDNHPSLQVNQEKQLFYCFSCQRKGDLINFIMQIENLYTKQACLFLGT
jgi:hypothetical protein